MSDKNPADYVIGPDVTIEDADLDETEIYYQGERITEARVDELGEQAAREAREHSSSVQSQISEATHEKLEAIAAARGISMSKLTQEVLDEFVARQTG